MSNRNSSSSRRRTSAQSSRGSRRAPQSRTSAAGRGGYSSKRNPKFRRRRPDYAKILLILAAAAAVILCIVVGIRACGHRKPKEIDYSVPENQITVDGINIGGMTREEAEKAILDSYGWNMKVTCEEKEVQVNNLMAVRADELLEEIYAGEPVPGSSYTVNTDNMMDAAGAEAALIAGNWNMVAQNGGISGYDRDSGEFTFTEGTNGQVIDQEKLAKQIADAVAAKDFGRVIQADVKLVSPELTAAELKAMYKTIATYTTTATNNSNRNENIRLACRALNGVIVNPGQEFSFNNTTGARTEEKGYKPASAYLNGEVVQEPGGGVCQVSSTLYNAIIFAGLKSTERHAHTFEPSYVTPGEDAAVSFGGPDFKFVNNSDYPVAIRTSFSNQKLTISVYGVPILASNEKIRMVSEKTGDIEPPAPVYEEDQTVQLDVEVEEKAARPGSRWSTYLVAYKDDKEVSREFFHNSSYRGKPAVIKRNTSGTVITTEGETLPGESKAPAEEVPGSSQEAGPGSLQPSSSAAGAEDQTLPQTGPQAGESVPASQPSSESGKPGPGGPAQPSQSEPVQVPVTPGGENRTEAANPIPDGQPGPVKPVPETGIPDEEEPYE